MTTETILTPTQVDSLLDGVLRSSGSRLGNYTLQKTLDELRSAVRAIEQAVLQSGQAQKWKQDSERYQWLKKQFRVMSLDMGGNHAWILRGPLRDGRTIDEVCDKSMEQLMS